MQKHKKCKKCKSPFNREEHKIDNYNIIIDRCKCGWVLVDVLDSSNFSLINTIDKKIIEKMLKSAASTVKF
ncbi:MAG: hypothetical protein OHK0040_04610 [bacterium]